MISLDSFIFAGKVLVDGFDTEFLHIFCSITLVKDQQIFYIPLEKKLCSDELLTGAAPSCR